MNETDFTKCPSCGGIMNYSPSTGNLKCIYCGSEKELDKSPTELTGHPYELWDDPQFNSQGEEEPSVSIKCKQCGATTTLPNNVRSTQCPFCGSPLIANSESDHSSLQPDYLIPFTFDSKNCKSAYRKWLSGKWFAPSKLRKNVTDPASFKGVYLPFWAYDADTHTLYRGKRGDEHTRTVDHDGERENETYTEWKNVSGEVDVCFENLLIAASDSLPVSIMNKLCKWNLKTGLHYKKEFISGFTCEIYKYNFQDSYPKAQKAMSEQISKEIKRDIGGDKQRILAQESTYENVKFKYILLPVWISSFKYKNKLYQMIVNGSTGEVIGEYPKSMFKITFVIVLFIAAVIAFYYLIM